MLYYSVSETGILGKGNHVDCFTIKKGNNFIIYKRQNKRLQGLFSLGHLVHFVCFVKSRIQSLLMKNNLSIQIGHSEIIITNLNHHHHYHLLIMVTIKFLDISDFM